MPIIERKCVRCHSGSGARLNLKCDDAAPANSKQGGRPGRGYVNLLAVESASFPGKYVHPGKARMSPVIWRIFGRNTSRPWDDAFSEEGVRQMPPKGAVGLTEDEKRTFVEWIDLGAMWRAEDE
jgi:hypothetical protein